MHSNYVPTNNSVSFMRHTVVFFLSQENDILNILF